MSKNNTNIKDELLDIIATSIVNGYGKASVEACIKILAFVVCYIEKIPNEQRKSVEKDLKWVVEEKIRELRIN